MATLSMGRVQSTPAFYVVVPFANIDQFGLDQKFNSLPENYKTIPEIYPESVMKNNQTAGQIFRQTYKVPARLTRNLA